MRFHQAGLTLIELMVVITILALLAISAAPLTGMWVKDSELLSTEANLTQAVGHAKAAALRNRVGATGDSAAATICISNTNVLTVLQGIGTNSPSCSTPTGESIWTTQLDADIAIKTGANAISCMCFQNRGFLTTEGDCSGCLTENQITVAAGNSLSYTVYLH